jgi:AraC-like DNA-binding protein
VTCALEDLFDRDEVRRTSTRIARARDDLDRIAICEEFLLAHYRPTNPDRVVSAALRDIDATNGAGRVHRMARELRVSQDTLEKRFRRVVGATPKQFSSIVRLRRAVDLLGRGVPIATLALDAGYYDQSHFTRDFRAVTGAAPAHFVRSAKYC